MKSTPRQKVFGISTANSQSRLAIASLFLVAVACSDSTAPVTPIQIVPAASTVTLQTQPDGTYLNTSVKLINTSSYEVTWSSCGVTLERAPMPALPPGKSDWTTAWRRLCYLLLAASAQAGPGIPDPWWDGQVLLAGQSVDIPISALVGDVSSGGFTGQPGQYRVRVPLAIRVLGTLHALPDQWSVSTRFTLYQQICIVCAT